MEKISVTKTSNPRKKPQGGNIPFGVYFTDHMFIMNYSQGKGWHDPRIVPYGPFEIDPASKVLHYAQEIFEGLKSYRGANGKSRLFRVKDNFKRLNLSCERLSIPQLDEKLAVEAVKMLVDLDKDWFPDEADTSLYIRPFIFATDRCIGVHSSKNYIFSIIMCPVGSYYPEGISPTKILIEQEDVRAVKGGTGVAKTGGNYAASLRAGERAERMGYSQVLWLDGVERKYIEEVGAMNVFFVIDGQVVTPELSGSILEGITRDSSIKLLESWGIPVAQRRISVDELLDAAESGRLQEAFGTGTAAVISPIGEIRYNDTPHIINNGEIGELSQRLYDELTGLQWGTREDPFGWTMEF